ncbi:MAG: 50S ribosomal protein L32 [Nitrospinota bacterium]|nr:50S ribosomal protein L32 [Nitrospinota bacterium]
MPVPKKKTSRSKRGMRRSHDKVSQPNYSVCPNCQETKMPHHVCPRCGMYGDKEVIAVEDV